MQGDPLAEIPTRELWEALDELRTENPLAFYNHPVLSKVHRKQLAFHASPHKIRCLFGGNRSGKSHAGVADNLIQAVDEEILADHLKPYKRFQPPFYCRIVTPDLGSTLDVVLDKLRDWCPKGQLKNGRWDRAWDKANRHLWFHNGSRFSFMSHEQDLDKFGGQALHRVHYDEEPPEPIRNECQWRLIDYGGDELFTMTPLMGMNWMYDRFYEPWAKGRAEGFTVVIVDIDDNPFLDEEAKARIIADTPAAQLAARKSGRFVHFAGLIYDDFSDKRHVIPERPPGHHSLIYVGIDPGIAKQGGVGVVWVEIDPSGTMTVFDELKEPGLNIAEVCRRIALTNAKWERRPEWYVIDPASRNKNHQTGRSDQHEYAMHGINAFAGQNAVEPGISKVQERLERQKLLITANCEKLIDEFHKYRWKTPSRLPESDEKPRPLKRNDHLVDPLRYICMALPLTPVVEDEAQEDKFAAIIRHDLEQYEKPRHEFGEAILA